MLAVNPSTVPLAIVTAGCTTVAVLTTAAAADAPPPNASRRCKYMTSAIYHELIGGLLVEKQRCHVGYKDEHTT